MKRNGLFALWVVALCCAFTQVQPITIYLVGDSTMAQKQVDRRPETGWGEALQQWFDIDHVRVVNLARNGRSTRTFISENRWQEIAMGAKKGDYVLIQFGHNDAAKDRPDRYTPPDEYRANLVRLVNDVRAREATPVLLTPVMRRRFRPSGEFYDSHGEYPDIVRGVAQQMKVALIDMQRRSELVIKQHGAAASKKLFLILQPGEHANYPQGIDDNTHFSSMGAELMAAQVAEGIRELKLPVAQRLRKLPAVQAKLYGIRPELLAEAKRRVAAREAAVLPAYHKLIQDADSALTRGPYTVTSKVHLPPSGDKHDYMSFGPYWWPDSTRPNGLPYIRRDGMVNPASRTNSDVDRKNAMQESVETLALAWYFTGDQRYADHAARLLRTWFIEPATRMNPHLRYGQAIPGITEGRGIGIIDTRHFGRITDAVALLQTSATWTVNDTRGMWEWMAQYLNWLITSQHGKDEAATRNNHGTWYDVQVIALALFTGDTALARKTAESAKTTRIAAQIDNEGWQAEELARTRSLGYSVMNLDGMTRLAELTRHVGVDLWNYTAPNGGSIRKAVERVAPFGDGSQKWPHPQINEFSVAELLPVLRRSIHVYQDASLRRSLDRIDMPTSRVRLLYPL